MQGYFLVWLRFSWCFLFRFLFRLFLFWMRIFCLFVSFKIMMFTFTFSDMFSWLNFLLFSRLSIVSIYFITKSNPLLQLVCIQFIRRWLFHTSVSYSSRLSITRPVLIFIFFGYLWKSFFLFGKIINWLIIKIFLLKCL